MHQYGFERLNVWQNSRELAKNVYLLTKTFPQDERFGIVSQMRRAAISISSNIAEGSSRSTAEDQAHFYNIAYSSAIELLNQLILALDLEYIQEEQYQVLRLNIEQITNQLNALQKSLFRG